jgi:hypothetical protein
VDTGTLPPARLGSPHAIQPGAVFQGARYGDTAVDGTVTDGILTLPLGSGDLQIDLG